MDETKLTIRIERATLEGAKRYARAHGTSLTRLPPEASLQDHREHLERKHA